MSDVVRTHRETALDSAYSRDRESAIEELAAIYEDASADDRREILETLREVILDSPNRSERELAREKLLSCFETDPSGAGDVTVETFRAVATESKFSGEREAAIDTLRLLHRDALSQREAIEEVLETIIAEATRENERQQARRRLSDLASDAAESSGSSGDNGNYLGVSLAEHLEAAADESLETCRRRATELRDFVVENQLTDDNYHDVREEIKALVEQLEVLQTDSELGEDRRKRIRSVASRVKRLYTRSG